MITQTMVQPSSWIDCGIQMSKIRDRYLFKFTEELQARLTDLNQRRKEVGLSTEEEAEWVGILELDRIFTLLNAKIIAES